MAEKGKYNIRQNAGAVKERAVRIPPAPVQHLKPATVRSIESLYTLREPAEVFKFLEDHPQLVETLLEAPDHIRKYFGETELVLEVVTDPDIEELTQDLFLYIRVDLEPEEGLSRLDQLDDDWGFEAYRENQGEFIIHLEYI